MSLIALSFIDIILYSYIPLMYTVWAMYLPFGIIFAFGLWSYLKKHEKGLFVFDIILVIIIIIAFFYSCGMFFSPTPSTRFWGIFGLFLVYLFVWMLYGTWAEYKTIKNEREKNDNIAAETEDSPRTTTDV